MPYLLAIDLDAENTTLGDLQVKGGQLQMAGYDTADESTYSRIVAQRIRTSLLMVQGEWLLDQRLGFPWHKVLGKEWAKIGLTGVSELITRYVVRVPGVSEIIQRPTVTIEPTTRTLQVTDLIVRSTTGQTITVDLLDLPMMVG